ncbi:DUF488 family protein [Candidatus Woesearchaeota archaeon]|nr:DUF488 family protein [Candidatus Woesearchaeota archaeon]
MLYTRCIFHPFDREQEGVRISVMSRHTLSDGKTRDPRITPATYDLWKPRFAPPDRLVGDWYKRGLLWEDFERRYLDYLGTIEREVFALAANAVEQSLTVLCIEESPRRCHRRLLAEECQRLIPRLSIRHL